MKTALPLLSAFVSLAVLGGCKNDPYVSPDDPHRASRKVPSIENSYQMVCLGRPPLSFLVKQGGFLKVVDATDKTIVLTAQILPDTNDLGTLVRADEELKAITVTPGREGAKASVVQPIQPDHEFEIYYQK